MMKNKNQRQTITTVRDALYLLESPGVTLKYLQELERRMMTTGGPHWTLADRMKYDAVLAAIEMLTNPVFIS